jgi:hypothetical protein
MKVIQFYDDDNGIYDYETLEKHFTDPKVKRVHKRLPRKLKKRINQFIAEWWIFAAWAEPNLSIRMWYLGWFMNPDYNRFLIKDTLNKYPSKIIHAELKPKFLNEDGSQMTTKERKEKYGEDWLN